MRRGKLAITGRLRQLANWPLDTFGTMIVALAMTVNFLLAYRSNTYLQVPGVGWWAAFDQGQYFKSAVAWSQGNLDPSQHWYLSGYPLLAAPFIKFMSVHAFAVPNLICLLVSLWFFTRIAAELAPRVPYAATCGALLFAAVTSISPLGLDIWVVPWSTTAAVPLVYACLLCASRFIRQSDRPIYAFLAGLTGSLISAFRPIDSLPVLLASTFGMVAAAVRRRPGRWQILVSATAIIAGVGLALCIFGAIYLPIYGFKESEYISLSNQIGFEYRLVPLHWVTLMLDPRPLSTDGQGLIEAFPWMAGGFAGLGVFLLLPLGGTNRLAHATIILSVVFCTILYLAYRAMLPAGLFQQGNYHYFKWIYPILALYAALLCYAFVTQPRSRVLIVGVALGWLAFLLPWRAELRVVGDPAHATPTVSDHEVDFESRLTSVRDVLLVSASGTFDAIYDGAHSLMIGNQRYAQETDFKTPPRPGGFLLTPLRPLIAGPARLTLDPRVSVDATVKPIYARQELVFGLPCWLPWRLTVCTNRDGLER
jgi:hypothetical protein